MSSAVLARKVSLDAGAHYLVQGPASFEVASGEADVCGARLPAGAVCRVPAGYRAPVTAAKAAEVSFLTGEPAALRRCAASPVPAAVESAVEALRGAKTVLVLGGVDVGKSFFVTYLANKLFALGRRVSVLDADLGQSDVGPPYCVGLLTMNDPAPVLSREAWTGIHFVGHGSPSGLEADALEGVRRLLKRAREEKKSDHVIVNTPGWIDGDAARAFLKSVGEAVSPDATVVLQRNGEAEAVAQAAGGKVLRLAAPAEASPVSTEHRTAYRKELLARYYANGRLLVLPFHHVKSEKSFFLSGHAQKPCLEKILRAERLRKTGDEIYLIVREPLTEEEILRVKREYMVIKVRQVPVGAERGLQVGLSNDRGDTLAMGVVRRFDFPNEFIELWTPLALGKESQVKAVRFGPLRVTVDGDEIGAVEAGSI